MPSRLRSAQIPGLPTLLLPREAQNYLGVGRNKWVEIKRNIDSIVIDGRGEFFTPEGLQNYLRRKTKKARPPELWAKLPPDLPTPPPPDLSPTPPERLTPPPPPSTAKQVHATVTPLQRPPGGLNQRKGPHRRPKQGEGPPHMP